MSQSPPPFALPSLRPTPSMASDDYEQHSDSRWSLVKQSTKDMLECVAVLNQGVPPERQIKPEVILVDTDIRVLTGSISSMTDDLDRVYADGGTNLVRPLRYMLQTYNDTPADKRHLISALFMTDGEHNRPEEMMLPEIQSLIDQVSVSKTFKAYLGIGTKETVDDRTLTHMSSGQAGSYTTAATVADLTETIKARCFEMLTAKEVKEAVVNIVCSHKRFISGATVVRYMTQTELDSLDELPVTKWATFTHTDSTCLITPCMASVDVSHVAQGQRLMIFTDKSGSMSDRVSTHSSVANETIPNPSAEQTLVHLSLPISSWTDTSYLFMEADVKRLSFEYTNLDGVRCHESIGKSEQSPTVMAGVTRLLTMMKWLESRVSIRDVRSFYIQHMSFLHDMRDQPEWLQSHAKNLWGKITERYRLVGPKRTADKQPGDVFFDAMPVPMMGLARTLSSQTTDTIRDRHSRVVAHKDDWKMCKICFEQPLQVLFTECGHAVTCVDCYKGALNSGCDGCPVCRQPVQLHEYQLLNLSHGLECHDCGQPSAYCGECTHILYCDVCARKHTKHGRVVCPHCPVESKPVKVVKFIIA